MPEYPYVLDDVELRGAVLRQVETLAAAAADAGQTAAEVEAAIDAIFPAWAETLDPRGLGAGTWNTPGANTAVLQYHLARRDLTIDTLKVFVVTASGNIDAGVYAADGDDFARLASSGSTQAAGTNAVQVLALTGDPIVIPRGTGFYLALACDNTTFSTARATVLANHLLDDAVGGYKASSFPLPETITGPLASALYVPWVRTAAP